MTTKYYRGAMMNSPKEKMKSLTPQAKNLTSSHSVTLLLRKTAMPIHKATGPRGGKGFQYGESGKVYPTRSGAVKQAQAIKASQAAAKKDKKK
jgi:hypothetical protein